MSDDKNNLLMLFEKPLEPLFTKRDGAKSIDMPMEYYMNYVPRYSRIIGDNDGMVARLIDVQDDEDVVHLYKLEPKEYPNLSFADGIDRFSDFSLFNQHNKQIAAKLTKIFLDAPDAPKLFATAAYVRDQVNITLFQYSLSVALQHRPDTKDLSLPLIPRLFPDKFVPPYALRMGRQTLGRERAGEAREKRKVYDIPLNYTANDNEDEQSMAYFREDIGVNSHHWHWHSVYPGAGDLAIVKKDRRGELFYYMHNQIISRYNVDRICNGLDRVKPLNDLRVPVTEAYFPKLIRSGSRRAFAGRSANTMLSDVNRGTDIVELADIERWSDRIHMAIDQGYVIHEKGNQISLKGPDGVDILGDVIEASILSPNPRFYGSLHEHGHTVISLVHDPDKKYLEEYGVMGKFETAMRDPLFYRWHCFIDNLFARHKTNLGPYNPIEEFQYNGVTVSSVSVQPVKMIHNLEVKENLLYTFWEKSDIELKSGLDFAADGSVEAHFTHLQHVPFYFKFTVQNNTANELIGTCRIFIGPKNDERDAPLNFEEQRKLMIEMDKFKIYLKRGTHEKKRYSTDSSVAIPYEKAFSTKIYKEEAKNKEEKDERAAAKDFCGCGWPQHMLLPKGSLLGTKFDVFIMISNYDLDRVDQPEKEFECSDATSFCGLKDQKYPDKRPMGFPFDRPNDVKKLVDFKAHGTNMDIGECVIQFRDEVKSIS